MKLALLKPFRKHAEAYTVMPDQLVEQARATAAEGIHELIERVLW